MARRGIRSGRRQRGLEGYHPAALPTLMRETIDGRVVHVYKSVGASGPPERGAGRAFSADFSRPGRTMQRHGGDGYSERACI